MRALWIVVIAVVAVVVVVLTALAEGPSLHRYQKMSRM